MSSKGIAPNCTSLLLVMVAAHVVILAIAKWLKMCQLAGRLK